LSSLLIWGLLFGASGIALIVTVDDVIEVAHSDETRLRLISRINAIKTELGNLEFVAGNYSNELTQAHADSYAHAKTILLEKVHELESDGDLGLVPAEITRIDREIADCIARIDAAIADRQSNAVATALLIFNPQGGEARIRVDEPLRYFQSLNAEAEKRLISDDDSLEHERDEFIWSFVVAGALCLGFQFWLYMQIRKDIGLRNQLEQQLAANNSLLSERVRERTRELDHRNHELAFLTRKLLETQEEERRRISLELHDEIGQDLAATLMIQRRMIRSGQGERRVESSSAIAECIETTQALYNRVSDMALALRPSILDRLGFAAAVNWYIRRAEKRSNCPIQLETSDLPAALPDAVSIAAFRILQEAISNAIRHAHASQIQVHVVCEQQVLELRIADNGAGFDMAMVSNDPDPFAGFGILGMKERAHIAGGVLAVQSSPGTGTLVVASFQLSAAATGTRAAADPRMSHRPVVLSSN
jgi:signal transduction histidine kinase